MSKTISIQPPTKFDAFLKTFVKVLCFVLVWKILVVLIFFIAGNLLPLNKTFLTDKDYSAPALRSLWNMAGNFDGNHYMRIAAEGYRANTQAFFPLFPMLIRCVHVLFGVPYVIAGQIISNMSLVVALVVIVELLKMDGFGGTSDLNDQIWWFPFENLLLFTVILFPTSFFLGVVYNDALFFCLASLTLLAGRRRQWILASIFGGLATLARLNGLALFWFLVFEYFSAGDNSLATWQFLPLQKLWKKLQSKFSPAQILRSGIFLSALIPLVFLGYLYFNQLKFHDWQVVFSNMKIWQQDKVTLPPQVIWRYLKILVLAPKNQVTYLVACLELGSVLFYGWLLLYGWRKIRLSYWIFFSISILIPWLTGSFQGMPRYGLHLYPMFLIWSLFLSKQPKLAQVIYLVLSFSFFVVCLTLFSRGYFIA